jgi:hypothetical protein
VLPGAEYGLCPQWSFSEPNLAQEHGGGGKLRRCTEDEVSPDRSAKLSAGCRPAGRGHEWTRASGITNQGSDDICGSVAAADGTFHLLANEYVRAESDDKGSIAAYTKEFIARHVTTSQRRSITLLDSSCASLFQLESG